MSLRTAILTLLCGAITLPVALGVVLGVGRLLEAMQDAAGAVVLGRIGLAVGMLWTLDLVLLVIALAAQVCLAGNEPPSDM